MATYRTSNAGGGTSGTGNRTATISAVAGDLLVVGVKWSGNSATNPTCTDDQAGTYDLILTALNNASADIMALFVRKNQVLTTATITVSPVVGSGTNTAGEIVMVAVSGMTRMGSNAIRGSGKQENQTTGVPTPVLGAAALTGNLTMTWAGSTTTAGSVPNASWTERQDASQISPTTVLEVATRDSGYTGTGSDVPYVSIASAVWSSAIIELNTTVPDFAYFDKEQWPIPEGRTSKAIRSAVSLLSWTSNLIQSTLFDPTTYTFRIPLQTKIEPKGYPVSLRSWDQGNLLSTLLGTPQAVPFSLDDWPNPNGPRSCIDLRTWINQTDLTLLGKDQFFGLSGNPQFDWPVPKGYVPAASLKTWTQTPNILAGQDRFFGLGGSPQFNWPNPRGPIPAIDLKTWLKNNTYLIGQDTFFGLAGHPTFDWPIPKGAIPATTLKTWTDPLKLLLAGQDQFFGLGGAPNFNWPNPRGPQQPIQWQAPSLLETLLSVFQFPFNVSDWPVPKGSSPVSTLRTWIQTLNLLAGTDTFFGLAGHPTFDWPNPKGYTPSTSLKTWIQELLPTLAGQDQFFGLAGKPNFDWPNPRGPVPAIDLKTWVKNLTYLIGSDQFFGLAGHPTFDWPNPRGYVPSIELRTWIERYKLELIGKDQLPELNVQWPNPRAAARAIELLTWLEHYKLELIGQDQLPELNVQWPNPRGYVPAIELRTWLERYKLELIGQDLLPFDLTDWPNPRGKQAPTLTWDRADLINLLYNVAIPFFETDWPVPKGSVPSVVLRTWLDAVKLNLLGRDQFFGLAGHPNFNWPNPTGEPPLVPPLILSTNPNLLPPTPVSADQLHQIIRFAPIAFGGRTHWTR